MHECLKKLKSHHEGGSAGKRKAQLIRHQSFVIYTHWARLAPILPSELGKAGKSLQRMKGDFPVCPITFPFLPGLPSGFPEGRSWGPVRSGLWGAGVPLAKAKKMNNRGCSALASQENSLVKYIFFGWSHVLKQAMKAGEDLDIELFKDNTIKCEEYNCNGVMADRLPELVVLK